MDDLIYNQRKIPKDRWRYGFRSSAATGCGWIAVYNALRIMNYRAAPEELIRYFERGLPLVHGNAGTTIPAPALFFLHHGFPVKMSAKRAEFDRLARESDVSIVFYRWRKGWKLGAHFITVRHDESGFTALNVFRTSDGPDFCGESLDAFLKKHGYFGAVLIAIRDKR